MLPLALLLANFFVLFDRNIAGHDFQAVLNVAHRWILIARLAAAVVFIQAFDRFWILLNDRSWREPAGLAVIGPQRFSRFHPANQLFVVFFAKIRIIFQIFHG